jgi:hypothetical protein
MLLKSIGTRLRRYTGFMPLTVVQRIWGEKAAAILVFGSGDGLQIEDETDEHSGGHEIGRRARHHRIQQRAVGCSAVAHSGSGRSLVRQQPPHRAARYCKVPTRI